MYGVHTFKSLNAKAPSHLHHPCHSSVSACGDAKLDSRLLCPWDRDMSTILGCLYNSADPSLLAYIYVYVATLNPTRALPSLNFVAVKLGAYSPDQHIVKHVIQARTSKFLPRSTFNCIPSTVTRFIFVCRVPCDEPSAAGFAVSATGIMSRRHWKGEPLTANTRGMAIAMPPRVDDG